MNMVPAAIWPELVARVRSRCPRLTPADLQECQHRVDLLSARIQNRHWISRDRARALVLDELRALGAIAV
jgi:hypothetical protein